jgi:hypothetical protein
MMGLSIAINVLALRPLTEVGRDELIDLIALLIQSATKASGDRQPRCRSLGRPAFGAHPSHASRRGAERIHCGDLLVP